MSLKLPVIVVINKIDRPDARCEEVVDEVLDLFIELGADETALDRPIVYASARTGTATLDLDQPGSRSAAAVRRPFWNTSPRRRATWKALRRC